MGSLFFSSSLKTAHIKKKQLTKRDRELRAYEALSSIEKLKLLMAGEIAEATSFPHSIMYWRRQILSIG